MTRRQVAEQAISKAVELRPVVLQVDHDFWVVASSTPGKGYMVERDPESGDLYCPCQAAAFTGTCYHRASVGLAIGTVPQAWIPAVDVPIDAALAS